MSRVRVNIILSWSINYPKTNNVCSFLCFTCFFFLFFLFFFFILGFKFVLLALKTFMKTNKQTNNIIQFFPSHPDLYQHIRGLPTKLNDDAAPYYITSERIISRAFTCCVCYNIPIHRYNLYYKGAIVDQ